jgi:hypothetical protein
MKKIIFLVSLLVTTSALPQSLGTAGGAATSPIDSSNSPSGQSFGGAMSGANAPAAVQPTSPANTQTSPSINRDLSVPRGTDIPQQRMEDQSNYAGGALGGNPMNQPGTTVPPATSYPSDTPMAPAVPNSSIQLPRTNGTSVPSDTGIGNP